jgi:hypothetical protein
MAVVVRALAVSDEEVSHLRVGRAAALGADLVIGAGDLSFEYLGALIDLVGRPGVFVPGNHDPDVSGFSKHAGTCRYELERRLRTGRGSRLRQR